MIYVTGDTHGEYVRFTNKYINEKLAVTKEDYIIVCGDLGLCWEKDEVFEYNCKFFSEKPYTLLWVQGNHENYNMIEEYPLENWHGGKVRHIVRDKVILLERGQVFELEEKKIFTFGGASSHDVQGGILNRNDCDFDIARMAAIRKELPFRILNETWWKQELPTEEELQEGMNNLQKHEFKVDYIITHCCATSIQNVLGEGLGHLYETDILTDYFDMLEKKVAYKQWFFGHYHMDKKIDKKHTLLYHGIMPIEEALTELIKVPVPGRPRYRLGEIIKVKWGDDEKVGKVTVVDAFGTFEQSEEPSYDVYVEEENCLYKHIVESDVVCKEMYKMEGAE